ncbi:MAG: hypothetical protein ACYCSO_09950 [Cuniculiplasma sp.]
MTERIRTENLTYDSPLIPPESDTQKDEKANKILMITLLLRKINAIIVKSGFDWRLYIFRVYFGTNLNMAESKGLISHPWREFIMGHKGDIKETHTKREDIVDEERNQYAKCLKFVEAEKKNIPEIRLNDEIKEIKFLTLKNTGYADEEIEKRGFLEP